MMNSNQYYPNNAYYQTPLSAGLKPYNVSQQPQQQQQPQQLIQSNIPPSQMSMTHSVRPQFYPQMEQQQHQQMMYNNAYRQTSPYTGGRPVKSYSNIQQQGLGFPGQSPNVANHPGQISPQRFPNTSYPVTYSQQNDPAIKGYSSNYSMDGPRPIMSYSQQNPYYSPSSVQMQRQYFDPRTSSYYGNQPRMNSDPTRMGVPNFARLGQSPQMLNSNLTNNYYSSKSTVPPIPSLPHSVYSNQPIVSSRKYSSDNQLRQALSLSSYSAKENISNLNKPMTIENIKPIIKKVKRLNNIGKVDDRKILMSLKSGLLAESTWALDCLNILSNNGTFRLVRIPSILTNLIDYYKCFLNCLFDDLFLDTQNDYQLKLLTNDDMTTGCDVETPNQQHEVIEPKEEKQFLLDSTNYTFQSRNGLPVTIKQDDEPESDALTKFQQPDYSRLEDTCDNQYFDNGNGLSTGHIIENMQSRHELIPFIKSVPLDGDSSVDNGTGVKENLKRKYEFDSETNESGDRDLVLCPRKESIESLIKRCHCISSIIRNLSFSFENSSLMAESAGLLLVLGRLFSFSHQHYEKKTFAIILHELENKTAEKENLEASQIFDECLLETLHLIKVNSFVTLSNLSEFLDLSKFTDKVILPLLDGLLHWSVCQSSYATDSFLPDNLSIQFLVLEIIAKLSMNISNIDLILATPPFSRIEQFYKILVESIGNEEDQVLRELSLVILSNFASADILSARIILHLDYSIINLISFVEQSEISKRVQYFNRIHSTHVVEPFTIAYMLRHAATTLRTMATVCDLNSLHLIKKYEDRIIDLTMSTFLEPEIGSILADLAYILSK